MTALTDQQLVQDLSKGDESALALLVDRYAAAVYRFGVRFSHDRSLAEDISQEVFLRVYRHAWRFNPSQSFKTWLFTIARNVCIDMVRGDQFRQHEHLGNYEEDSALRHGQNVHESQDPTPEEQAISRQTDEAVRKALHILPENQRTCVILRYFEEMSVREIAVVMDTTVSAVESLLVRAKRNLAKSLGV